MIKPTWTLIRTFAAVGAEGHAAIPLIGSFIAIPGPIDEDVEISFGAYGATGAQPANALTVAGAPTSIAVWIWALHDDGTIAIEEPLAKVILAGADSGVFSPVIIRPGQSKLYVTFDAATGGAGVSVTGRVHARRVGR